MSTSPKLQSALRRYRQRAQFHDEPLLQEIIAAVREEEAAKYAALHVAAVSIATPGEARTY